LSLSQLAKILCLSYYCLCLLFNKIGEKGRTGTAWRQEELGRRRKEWGKEGEMAQTMYAYVNK
jgi:hypothetical protein